MLTLKPYTTRWHYVRLFIAVTKYLTQTTEVGKAVFHSASVTSVHCGQHMRARDPRRQNSSLPGKEEAKEGNALFVLLIISIPPHPILSSSAQHKSMLWFYHGCSLGIILHDVCGTLFHSMNIYWLVYTASRNRAVLSRVVTTFISTCQIISFSYTVPYRQEFLQEYKRFWTALFPTYSARRVLVQT